MKTFHAGKSYSTRSICDHETIIEIEVVTRTAKTLTLVDGKKLRIGVYQNAEFVRPNGNYSMAPIIRASS